MPLHVFQSGPLYNSDQYVSRVYSLRPKWPAWLFGIGIAETYNGQKDGDLQVAQLNIEKPQQDDQGLVDGDSQTEEQDPCTSPS